MLIDTRSKGYFNQPGNSANTELPGWLMMGSEGLITNSIRNTPVGLCKITNDIPNTPEGLCQFTNDIPNTPEGLCHISLPYLSTFK